MPWGLSPAAAKARRPPARRRAGWDPRQVPACLVPTMDANMDYGSRGNRVRRRGNRDNAFPLQFIACEFRRQSRIYNRRIR